MTVVVIALALVLAIVAIVAGGLIRRVIRAGERRELRLEQVIRERDEQTLELLDRMQYAMGKPWKDTADRPDDPIEADPFGRLSRRVIEDPVPGGDYAGDHLFDELEHDLRSPDGDSVYVPAGETFDTATLESGL